MLSNAKKTGYEFISFDQVDELKKEKNVLSSAQLTNRDVKEGQTSSAQGKCLLRHDVDTDLGAAVLMGEKEALLGISATYFLMLRSPCYNLLSRQNQSYAETLISFGHKIGLHYDQGFDVIRNTSLADTKKSINQQANWLEVMLGCEVSAVSFHQPSKALLQENLDCGYRVNTYDKNRLEGFSYISDSNREFSIWKQAASEKSDFLKSLAYIYPRNIQLLIHPMWWVYNDTKTEDVWNRVLIQNFENMQKQIIETERAFGKKRLLNIES